MLLRTKKFAELKALWICWNKESITKAEDKGLWNEIDEFELSDSTDLSLLYILYSYINVKYLFASLWKQTTYTSFPKKNLEEC